MPYLMMLFLCAAFYHLMKDAKTREREYTKPLSTMPENAKALLDAIVANDIEEAGKRSDGSVSGEDKEKIVLSALKMLAEGSVEQRNWEMNAVRKQISLLGYLFSWFLKQKGLTYKEIENKFSADFSDDRKKVYWAIIASASRANPNLFEKLMKKILGPAKL